MLADLLGGEHRGAAARRRNTHLGYKVDVDKHLIPGVGAHRLERLEPEHLERLYARMRRSMCSGPRRRRTHRRVHQP